MIHISDKIIVLKGKRQGRPPYSHALFINDRIKVLVDTGCGQDKLQVIKERYGVDVIINSHCHFDHINGNELFPQAELWMHEDELPVLRSKRRFCQHHGLKLELLPRFLSMFPDRLEYKPRPATRVLNGGESIDTGSMVWQVVHTPGHTSGHICLYQPDMGLLFSGDIDLSPYGPWYGDKWSDISQFQLSLERLRGLRINTVITGHGKAVCTNVDAHIQRYAAIIEQRDSLIVQYLRKRPLSLKELNEMSPIYPTVPEPRELYSHFSCIMLQKHLARLGEQGKLRVNDGLYYAV